MRDKLGYLFGDFGNDFTFVLASSFLLKFYADVMGVEAAVVGAVMMAARFVDAFTDVAMGRICDRSRPTPEGKFRPWIRRMCIPAAVSSFLIYQSGLAQVPLTLRIVYLFVTYILWSSVFYTAVNIPYGSMVSAISADPDDRQSLSTFRSMGAALAGVVIGAGVPIFAYEQSGGHSMLSGPRFTAVAGACSVLAVICYALCYLMTTERVGQEAGVREHERMSTREMFGRAVRSRALLSVTAASIVMLLAQQTMQSMAGFIYPNYYNSPAGQSASTFMMLGGMSIAAASAKRLARRFGKAEVSAASSAFACVVCVVLYFVRPQSVWAFVALQGLCWLGLGVFSMVSWALITDVIDDSELRSGIREDGSVYALYSFARKLGQAASAGLSGVLLSLIGYTQETAFDRPVVEAVFNIATLLPGLGFGLLAAILWFWYPLHREKVNENLRALKARRGEGEERSKE